VTGKALAIEVDLIEHVMSTTGMEECNRVGETMKRMINKLDDWQK